MDALNPEHLACGRNRPEADRYVRRRVLKCARRLVAERQWRESPGYHIRRNRRDERHTLREPVRRTASDERDRPTGREVLQKVPGDALDASAVRRLRKDDCRVEAQSASSPSSGGCCTAELDLEASPIPAITQTTVVVPPVQ